MQDDTTGHMIFDVAGTIAYLSDLMTLEPGDVIATGTPAGVGFKRQPPRYLHPGDVVEVAIGGIGALRNPVIAEPADRPGVQAGETRIRADPSVAFGAR